MSKESREAWRKALAVKAMHGGPKRSKYSNVKTSVDGVTFDSAKEARRYQELKLQQMAGQIARLRWQVAFPLYAYTPGGVETVAEYVADFTYLRDGQEIVEDVKSAATRVPLYRLKRKIFEANRGLTITEI
jgi:hypothetical protein